MFSAMIRRYTNHWNIRADFAGVPPAQVLGNTRVTFFFELATYVGNVVLGSAFCRLKCAFDRSNISHG